MSAALVSSSPAASLAPSPSTRRRAAAGSCRRNVVVRAALDNKDGGIIGLIDRATKKQITKEDVLRNQEQNVSEQRSVFGAEPSDGAPYPRPEVERRPETGDRSFPSLMAFDGAGPETINGRLARRRRRRQEQAESPMFFLKNSSSSSALLDQAVHRAAAMAPSDGKQQQPKKKKNSKSKTRSKHSNLSGQPDKGLLLGCNPCANGTSSMVVEDYKFKLGFQRSARGYYNNKQEQVPASGIWEREKSWNIVAKMGDKIVAKKIVLKKKKRQPAPCSVPFSSEGPATLFCDEASCLSSKYRLSTSSGDACHWESGRLVWDRELSFVSGDDFGLEDDLDPFERLESSTKDGFSSFRGSPLGRRRFGSSKQFPSPDRSEDEADDEWDNEEDKEEVGKGIIQGSLGDSGSVSDVSEWSSDDKPKLAKVGHCRGQAVFKESVDPYRDYMESVLAMMAANHLTEVSELEELKRCYLLLNPPELHGTIAMVFNQVLRD